MLKENSGYIRIFILCLECYSNSVHKWYGVLSKLFFELELGKNYFKDQIWVRILLQKVKLIKVKVASNDNFNKKSQVKI